jgi:hypothetical protein
MKRKWTFASLVYRKPVEKPALRREATDLLQEHRMALISAAVTGQIDVRNIATGAPVSKPA